MKRATLYAGSLGATAVISDWAWRKRVEKEIKEYVGGARWTHPTDAFPVFSTPQDAGTPKEYEEAVRSVGAACTPPRVLQIVYKEHSPARWQGWLPQLNVVETAVVAPNSARAGLVRVINYGFIGLPLVRVRERYLLASGIADQAVCVLGVWLNRTESGVASAITSEKYLLHIALFAPMVAARDPRLHLASLDLDRYNEPGYEIRTGSGMAMYLDVIQAPSGRPLKLRTPRDMYTVERTWWNSNGSPWEIPRVIETHDGKIEILHFAAFL